MKRELSQADVERCVAWLDGELEGAERDQFELRLASEPDLARTAQELVETDELMRRLDARARAKVVRRARLRPWLWAGSLAAAAAVLVGIAATLLAPRATRAGVDAAVLPSYESASELVASVPALRGLRPPGLDVLRGESQEPNVGAAEFAAEASAAEDALALQALQTGRREASAGFFVIPLALDRRSAVRVWAFPRSGEPMALHPGDVPDGSLPDGVHVLPGPRFRVEESGEPRVVYKRGYLVPIGCEALDVVVATRAWSKGVGPIEREDTADETQRALERDGWTVMRLLVREPE